MHEASIASSLLEIAAEHCAKNNYNIINSLTVRVGKLGGVMPDALAFAFDALKEGTRAAGAQLIIKEIEGNCGCNDCKGSFTFNSQYILSCPMCGSGNFVITGGRELELIEMEVDNK